MKKITIVGFLIIISHSLYSQSWLEVGLKGGYGLDFMINKNLSNDITHTMKFSYGYTYGGKLGWNFNEAHAVTLDVLYTGFSQSYEYYKLNPDSTKSFYKKSFAFNSLDFLLMYRHTKNASYFEIGPQFSTIKKANGTDSNPGSKFVGDVSSNLSKTYYSAVIGAGGLLAGTENFRVILGIRVLYALDDIISQQGQNNNFPSGNKYGSYQKSNPLSAMMVLEMNYDLGFLAKTNCKKKKTSFLFFKN